MKKYVRPLVLLLAVMVIAITTTMLIIHSIERRLVNQKDNGSKSIAVITYSLSDSIFYREFVDAAVEYAASQGYSVQTLDGKGNSIVQINQIESLMLSGTDAIIIDPCDPVALSFSIKKAMDSGIKTVVIGKETEYYDCFCNSDHYACGRLLAEYACNWINSNLDGRATIAVLNGPTLDNLEQRELGITDTIRALSPDSTVIASVQGIDQLGGLNALQTLMTAYPDINVVLCVNDDGALGAVKYVDTLAIDPNTFFIGSIDGTALTTELLGNGSLFKATVTIDASKSAIFSTQAAIDLIEGKSARSVQLDGVLVDASNVSSYDI